MIFSLVNKSIKSSQRVDYNKIANNPRVVVLIKQSIIINLLPAVRTDNESM